MFAKMRTDVSRLRGSTGHIQARCALTRAVLVCGTQEVFLHTWCDTTTNRTDPLRRRINTVCVHKDHNNWSCAHAVGVAVELPIACPAFIEDTQAKGNTTLPQCMELTN